MGNDVSRRGDQCSHSLYLGGGKVLAAGLSSKEEVSGTRGKGDYRKGSSPSYKQREIERVFLEDRKNCASFLLARGEGKTAAIFGVEERDGTPSYFGMARINWKGKTETGEKIYLWRGKKKRKGGFPAIEGKKGSRAIFAFPTREEGKREVFGEGRKTELRRVGGGKEYPRSKTGNRSDTFPENVWK